MREAKPPEQRFSGGKILTFLLGNEEYGIDVLKVVEIIRKVPITRVPGTPEFVRGIINLRGRVVPVVDLCRRLGIERREDRSEACIIILQMQEEVGIIVDRVCDVCNLTSEQVLKSPEFIVDVDTDYLLGIAKVQDSFKILLDIDRILSERGGMGKEPGSDGGESGEGHDD